LSSEAVDVLAWLAPAFGELKGKVFEEQSYSRMKSELDKLLPPDMPGWVLHDCRRTAASGMAALGVQLPVIEKVLNHQSGSFRGVCGVYQRHSYSAEKREALEKWSGHVAALTGVPVALTRAA
jgi:integrase